MNIKVKVAPLGAKFDPDVLYHVYGYTNNPATAFVFDENNEAFYLFDLAFEEPTYEDD